MSKRLVFFGPDDYAEVRRLIKAGDLKTAHNKLMHAEPVPAVLYQLLRVIREWAHQAAKQQDWKGVLRQYDTYTTYAAQCRDYCIRTVNQEPPELSQQDLALIERAQGQLKAPTTPAR